MSSRLLILAALPVVLGATACSEAETAEKKKPAGRRGPPPALVKVVPVAAGDLDGGWTFLGQVEPALSAALAPAVAGHIRSIKVRSGDRVKAHQTLVVLDTDRIGASVGAAKAKERQFMAELAQAKRQWERVKHLKPPSISVTERERFKLAVDTFTAKLKSQQAETRRERVEYMNHIIKAPFAGVIQARHFNPGSWISIGQPVLEIVSLEKIEVHVDVSVDIGVKLAKGTKAVFHGAGSKVVAVVAGVVPGLNTTTRTMRVRLVPEKPAAWLIPAMPVDVEFKVPVGGGVTVPRDALIRGPSGVRVVKAVGDQGVPVPVQIIATAKQRALVRGEKLAVGDMVIVRGNERLRPGQPIKVVK